jgi:hypothetical protein
VATIRALFKRDEKPKDPKDTDAAQPVEEGVPAGENPVNGTI